MVVTITAANFMRAYTAVNNSGLSCTRSDISLLVNRLPHRGYCVILSIGKDHEARRLYPSSTVWREQTPSGREKGGIADVCYIC